MDIPYLDEARRGAALLDRERPGWRSSVDADHLNMEEYLDPEPFTDDYAPCAACILGWVFWQDTLEFRDALSLLGLRAYTSDAADHGFVIADGLYDAHAYDSEEIAGHWKLLLAAWQTVLAEEVAA